MTMPLQVWVLCCAQGGVKGKRLFEIARRNVPDSSLFAHHLGEVLRKMNKLNAAVENYDDAVKLNPTFHAAKKRLHELEKRGIFPNSKIQSNIFFLYMMISRYFQLCIQTGG